MAFGVGSFASPQGRTVLHKLPSNPMDRSTIVSLIPKLITEYKPTLFPGRFIIPAAKMGDYELYIVEPSSYFLANSIEKMPPTEVQVNSVQLAESIVKDYLVGIPECNMGDRMPGLFWIPGAHNRKTIESYVEVDVNGTPTGKTFKTMLDAATLKQKNWYLALVATADNLWVKSGGAPRAVSDDARIAAEALQLREKPWMADRIASELINCKFCGEMVNPAFPVCKHCHAILDPKRAKELDIQFAAK